MGYESTRLKQQIVINKIITIHYFEYMRDFVFKGEAHNFWEFLCVDKGEIEVRADERVYKLGKGDVIFHKPMEFHALRASGNMAPNLVVISFETNGKWMSFFEEKIFSFGDLEWHLISKIIMEAKNAFCSPLNMPSIEKVEKNPLAPFGAEQLIKIYIEELLINLVRKDCLVQKGQKKITSYIKEKSDQHILSRINHYLESNICRSLMVTTICKDNLMSRSKLQELFHKHYNCGVMEHFNTLKVDVAKQLIRNQNMNFTQIAYHLGYTTIHSFSKQFKRITGMSPSEYANSVKIRSEDTNRR